jgi:hypothetical protein
MIFTAWEYCEKGLPEGDWCWLPLNTKWLCYRLVCIV